MDAIRCPTGDPKGLDRAPEAVDSRAEIHQSADRPPATPAMAIAAMFPTDWAMPFMTSFYKDWLVR